MKITITSIIPSFFAAMSGFLGSGLLVAILFGLITKVLLYFFDKEIKSFALKARSLVEKLKAKFKKYK
jgi:membrane protein YqaA with SNARE-associated domain